MQLTRKRSPDGFVRGLERFAALRAVGSVSHVVLGWVLALPLLVAPAASAAQVVEGRLLDSDTRRPIPDGVVTLTDSAGDLAAASTTGDDGRFVLRASEPGRYYVVGRAVGYWPKRDGVIELGEDGWIPIDFYLRPAPIEVPGVTARARGEGVVVDRFMQRDKEYLEWQGFYERQKMGFGDFITPEELERRQPIDAHALLRGIPGIRAEGSYVRCTTAGSVSPGRIQGQRAIPAPPVLYVDGVRVVDPVNREGLLNLEGLVPIGDMGGVEVYTRASQRPLQYSGTLDSPCVILVWTKG